jgi:hypothetical protein
MTKPVQFAINFKPVKRREVDTPKAAVSELFDQVGGVKEVQVRLGIGKSQAYAYTDPAETQAEITFARVAALTGPGASAAAEYLASRAGGVFCALPQSTGECPMTMSADSARESGQAVAKAIEALTSKTSVPGAKAKVVKEIDEAICAFAALRRHFVEDDQ